LAAAVLLLGGVFLSKTSSRFGVPSLLLAEGDILGALRRIIEQ
jgi:NhaP-type Na+/H+ and K+/H+ antiporter